MGYSLGELVPIKITDELFKVIFVNLVIASLFLHEGTHVDFNEIVMLQRLW